MIFTFEGEMYIQNFAGAINVSESSDLRGWLRKGELGQFSSVASIMKIPAVISGEKNVRHCKESETEFVVRKYFLPVAKKQ